MYGRAIKLVTNKSVQQSTIKLRFNPSNFFSSTSTQHNNKDSNLVDDIRSSASGLPSAGSSGAASSNIVNDIRDSASGLPTARSSGVEPASAPNDRVNVVKTITTPSTSPPTFDDRREDDNGGDMGSFVADTAKQGVAKAIETGLDIGEMAKQTLDNVWDATKGTGHAVKEAVTGDEKAKNDVPPTDRFVDDLRKRDDGYDLRNK
ncbi:uncharacterized protein [Rutidosis leptorrhynchoides]|uniref:uncharacterized protein n=1 Tax=Rutidosis leptorrhynchoides TaxID=125765 RepID=UPI003A997BD2